LLNIALHIPLRGIAEAGHIVGMVDEDHLERTWWEVADYSHLTWTSRLAKVTEGVEQDTYLWMKAESHFAPLIVRRKSLEDVSLSHLKPCDYCRCNRKWNVVHGSNALCMISTGVRCQDFLILYEELQMLSIDSSVLPG